VDIEGGKAKRDGRERLLLGAGALLAERGYEATDLRDAAARGSAPRGSIYHHFPEGKVQLATEAAARMAERVAAVLERSLAEQGVLATLQLFAREFLRTADEDASRVGCPVAALALAPPDERRLHAAAAEAFARWEELLDAGLRREGVTAQQSRHLAALILATVEGALLRARAQGQRAGLEEAMDGLQQLLRPLLGRTRARSG
jgi:AcrR family transcriptional regulator